MKSTALIIILFIGLASCHIKFFEAFDSVPEDQENVESKQDDIGRFFIGLFSHFKLQIPSQILDCFNNVNARLYFSLIQELNRILEDTKERNSLQLHLELAKLAILDKTLTTTHACITATQDFNDLLEVLNITQKDPTGFEMYLYLYYQAHYLDLAEGFKPVIDNLNSRSILAAGDAFGVVLNDLVYTVKNEGSAHLAFAGFGNGAAISLGINEPDDSLQCYDNSSSKLYLEFTYKMALAVSEGTIKEASLNAYKFWEREGKDIMNQIPQSVFECEANSTDIQNINTKLGADVTSEEFLQRMLRYIIDNRFSYYAISKSMKGALEHHNFHHAGSIHAHFLKEIVKHTL